MSAVRLRRNLSAWAAAGVLASSASVGAPAWAADQPAPEPTPSVAAGTAGSGLSDAALADAVRKDLGLTPEQFAGAGERGAQAAAAALQLRDVPGYTGIRLEGGYIIVSGSGQELQSKVAALAGTVPDIAVEAPAVPKAAGDAGAGAAAGPAAGSELAVSAEQLFQAYVRDVGPTGLQAVLAVNGKFVIRTGELSAPESTADTPVAGAPAASPGKLTPAQFAAKYANVELDGGAPLKPEADVPGGVGYQTDQQTICSTGYSAFDPAGIPSVLTAGHCTDDGVATTADLLLQGLPNGRLGTFEFSQFGGPGNSTVLNPNSPNPGNVGVDIAVLGNIREDLDPLPATSTYGDPSQPGPDVKIIGTAAPVIGMPVCRSGWRTEWSCGHVSAVGIFLVGGHTYPADPNDIRAFSGFLSLDVQSSGGDSGGPWISGNYAVGTHSAGDWGGAQNFAVAATLEDSLQVLPGYQLELFLNKPELAAAPDRTYKAGTSVTGRVAAAPASVVAAGSQVRITYAGRPPFDVPVDGVGNWSFTAPEAPGPFTFTAETVNGFSRSGPVSLDIVITPSFLPAPVITTPAGEPLPELRTIEGTGTPGATVSLSGDATGSALADAAGHWSVSLPAPGPYGKADVTAVQTYPGLADSPAATATFTVVPPPPASTNLSDGQHLQQDALPATIKGTGLEGAEVAVSVDGKPVSAMVSGGTWSVPFPAGLAAGPYTMSMTQAVEGVSSAPAQLTVTIDAPPPVLPAGNITGGTSLANTGANGLVPAAGAAMAAIAVGGVLMLLVRRRKRLAR